MFFFSFDNDEIFVCIFKVFFVICFIVLCFLKVLMFIIFWEFNFEGINDVGNVVIIMVEFVKVVIVIIMGK